IVAVVTPQIVELDDRVLSQRYLNSCGILDSIPQILTEVIVGLGGEVRAEFNASDFEVALSHQPVPVSSLKDAVDPAKVAPVPFAQQYVQRERKARDSFEDNPVFLTVIKRGNVRVPCPEKEVLASVSVGKVAQPFPYEWL